MRRIQILMITMAVAVALPSGAAFAQSPTGMAVAPSSLPEPDVPSPMQEQAAVPAANRMPALDSCGSPRVVTMKDEFGRTYNCRGDRIR